MPTWCIVGASRGIGLELARQLLAQGHTVIASARSRASKLEDLAAAAKPGQLHILLCDVSNEESIKAFAKSVAELTDRLDYVVVNAGVNKYPNRATEVSFADFAWHLNTNTIGVIVAAQQLLKQPRLTIGTIAFMSSDSGSTASFRDFEDGLAAYAASKAALNQALRHMAAELKRKGSPTVILALHPGEVETDMSNPSIETTWELPVSQIQAEESVRLMLPVITSKTVEQSGTFWTWEGNEYPW